MFQHQLDAICKPCQLAADWWSSQAVIFVLFSRTTPLPTHQNIKSTPFQLTVDWLSTQVVNSFSCSTGMVLLRFTTLAIMPPAAGARVLQAGLLDKVGIVKQARRGNRQPRIAMMAAWQRTHTAAEPEAGEPRGQAGRAAAAAGSPLTHGDAQAERRDVQQQQVGDLKRRILEQGAVSRGATASATAAMYRACGVQQQQQVGDPWTAGC